MPIEVKNGLELRKALKGYAPELSIKMQKEMGSLLRSITNKAKGYVPSESPLTNWEQGKQLGGWEYRAFSTAEVRSGITYSTTPSRPNKSGFRTLAAIINKSAAGAIYETAGRKNPNGQPQVQRSTVRLPGHVNYGRTFRSKTKGMSISDNPNAGKQMIDAINETGRLVDIQDPHLAGRRTRKTKGRLIFRAWAEDNGRVYDKINRLLASQNMLVEEATRKAA